MDQEIALNNAVLWMDGQVFVKKRYTGEDQETASLY